MPTRRLSRDELRAFREAILGPHCEALAALMCDLSLGHAAEPGEALALALRLHWVDPQGARLTRLGQLVADSLREFRLWQERGTRPYPRDADPRVAAILDFDGKRVLDVGCGFGCNLLSAQGRAVATFGVDLEPSYLQLGPILAERAGLAVPPVARADAASLPLASQRFDMVLCASVIQYVDPRPALSEAHRVLRPGGELVLFAATFGQMLRAHLRSARWSDVAWAAHHLRMVLNTLALQLTGRRLLGGGSHSTAAPVHPTRRHHLRLLEAAGLRVRDAVDMAGRGVLFHAARPET